MSVTGVGKTHLSVALGLKPIEAGYRTFFNTAANLIAPLTKAHTESSLDEKLKMFGDRIIANTILDRLLHHARSR